MTDASMTLDTLRERVRGRLGDARFAHTLGVERACCRLGECLLPDAVDALRAAALLHDITKEYGEAEHHALLRKCARPLPEDARHTPALLHSLTAPLVIERDFPAFATADILSAVACHTTGKVAMSTFDKILYISDYIEDGRTYPACVQLRSRLTDALRDAPDTAADALDRAVLAAMDNTIISLVNRASIVSEQTFLARNSLLASICRG